MTAVEGTRDTIMGRAHSGVLAVALQEVLTGAIRVQTHRQTAADVETFRDSVKQLLRTAHAHVSAAGVANEDSRLAMFAAVVLFDEAVLNSADPALAGWSRQPLQEELFGGHTGGAVFFDTLRTLLARQDSDQLADVLEVYGLCLQLGFRGQYGQAGSDDLRRWTSTVFDRIARIRGGAPVLAPEGLAPANETILVTKDPWMRRLMYVLLGLVAAAVVVWALMQFVFVPSWLSDLRAVRPPR